jgi:N-acetylneuraminate lyase
VHVGHNSIEDARHLARQAAEIGCDAIAAMGPSFFTATSAESLVESFRAITQGNELPFYYYHFPSMTQVRQKASELLPLLKALPTFRGIKFTHNDLDDFALCVREAEGRYEMLFGRDEFLLDGLAAGADGAVGSTYNYAAPIYRRLIDAYFAGDETTARAQQTKARGFIEIFLKYGGLESGKALMKMCGIDCGPMRLPLASLTPEAFQKLFRELEAFGFFADLAAPASLPCPPAFTH